MGGVPQKIVPRKLSQANGLKKIPQEKCLKKNATSLFIDRKDLPRNATMV